MSRWLIALVLAGLLVGCDDNNPAAPDALPLVFSAVLSPANEVPAITNAESGGRGTMQVQFDVTRGSNGAITAATATMYFGVQGFPGNTTTIGAHIHTGVAGVNGPVVINTGLSGANTLPLANGMAEFTVSGVAVDPALLQSIVDNPSAFYFNVHSPLNPGGYARGQLRRVQ